ncbi:MAG: RNA polymerase sigma factor SigF [Candidatus Nanopelagicales bacterium]
MNPPQTTTSWTEESKVREKELIAILASDTASDSEKQAARDELVTIHIPLVEFLARRFRDRGESPEDLRQVGMIGLIKAVDRYDPDRGAELSTFATPTIVGEIKRHFRDHGWSVRVPRRLQELRMKISAATDELSQKTGRPPTVNELAEHLEITPQEVVEGLESAQAYSTSSLDSPGSGGGTSDEGNATLMDTLGDDDEAIDLIVNRETLRPLLDALDDRERTIIISRFFKNQTQAQIAKEVGVSQMHVSRLLNSALAQLREGLEEDAY